MQSGNSGAHFLNGVDLKIISQVEFAAFLSNSTEVEKVTVKTWKTSRALIRQQLAPVASRSRLQFLTAKAK